MGTQRPVALELLQPLFQSIALCVSYFACRVTSNHSIGLYVPCYYRASPYNRVIADTDAFEYRCSGTNPNVVAYGDTFGFGCVSIES